MIKLELSDEEKKGLTEDECEIAMARKLEILLIPYLRRNIDFFYAGANIPKKYNAYHQRLVEEDITRAIEGRNNIATVCKPFCEMVVSVLKENGINAATISCDTDMFKHTDVLVTTKTGKQYIINYLEDIENIQTKMQTPDFASKQYFDRRYKKFIDGITTDGTEIGNIQFVDEQTLDKIDTKLGYKKYGLYMNEVISMLKEEFANMKNELEYKDLTDDELLEMKMDWIFNNFNSRWNIVGHTDFVMYYSRLLLKEVLSPEEYNKLTRYDCFIKRENLPNVSQGIKDVLDLENEENGSKIRFCLVGLKDKAYAFSTKPNVYRKLPSEELEALRKYAKINESQRPSDFLLALCDRGNALPLVFHPLGSQFLNNRAAQIDDTLSPEERKQRELELAAQIKATDRPVTSITIPYDNGDTDYLYINQNKEFAVRKVRGNNRTTIVYHYNEAEDTFNQEVISDEQERE